MKQSRNTHRHGRPLPRGYDTEALADAYARNYMRTVNVDLAYKLLCLETERGIR